MSCKIAAVTTSCQTNQIQLFYYWRYFIFLISCHHLFIREVSCHYEHHAATSYHHASSGEISITRNTENIITKSKSSSRTTFARSTRSDHQQTHSEELQNSTGDLTVVRVGILIENTASLYHNDVRQGLHEINETLKRTKGVQVESIIDISYGVDPYKTLTRACSLLSRHPHVLLSKTSCESANTLQHMADRLGIVHLFLPHTSSCQHSPIVTHPHPHPIKQQPGSKTLKGQHYIDSQMEANKRGETNDESNTHNDVINNIDDASGNLQQPTNGRKDSSTIQQYNIPMGTSVVPVVDLVLTIVARLRWGKVVVISDSTNPYQLNSFYSTLSHRLNPQSSASQSSAAEDYSSDDTFSTLNNFLQLYSCKYLSHESTKYVNQVVSCIKDLLMPEHSRPSPSSSSTSSFSKSGENEMEVFKNFVVIANTENSLRILDEGKRAGLIGQSYKWVLANPDVDPGILPRISNDTNVIAVIRAHSNVNRRKQSWKDRRRSSSHPPRSQTEPDQESSGIQESSDYSHNSTERGVLDASSEDWLQVTTNSSESSQHSSSTTAPFSSSNSFQTQLLVNFLKDSIYMTAHAVLEQQHQQNKINHHKHHKPPLNFNAQKKVSCFDDGSANSDHTSGSSNHRQQNNLFHSFTFDHLRNNLTGHISFPNAKGGGGGGKYPKWENDASHSEDRRRSVSFSPDLLAVRYTLLPNYSFNNPFDKPAIGSPNVLSNDTHWEIIAEYLNGVGEWVEKNSSSLFRGDDRFDGLKGIMLRIVTIEEEPFIIKERTSAGTKYSGYCIDILKAIQRHVTSLGTSFDYQLYEVEDSTYGIYDQKKKRWTGLVGDIVTGKADMAVAGMIRNYERESVVDFAASFMDYGVGILVRKPSRTTSAFGFLEPFTVQVWLCISIASFVIGVCLFILSKMNYYIRFLMISQDEEVLFSFHNSMWFTLASLMQQGCDVTPNTISGRIIGTFWWFFTLIIIATYTANLAAFLTVTRMDSPIEGLTDLATQQKVVYGTVAGSSLEHFFEKQAEIDATYKQIWKQMDSSRPQSMVSNVIEGYSRVKNGDYAFMWDYPVLQYQKKRYCELTTVGKPFNRKNYAFALPKNAIYLESITLSILALQETGELEKLRQKWFEAESRCPEDDSTSSSSTSSSPSGDSQSTARGLQELFPSFSHSFKNNYNPFVKNPF
ncbi:uncharacterized protein LOC142336706 [Convolutriloba macropyga]|uniref:uncharacterized protein LOC142336706 n=1 Tax=Convolutriloba macropyga TaxID=536237 RepID=UPI003F52131A